MKFKSFISEYTNRQLSELISQSMIPLVPSMMQRLGYYWEDVTAYHVTNSRFLEDMVKKQKKSIHLSTFTRGGAELSKLPSQPDVLLKLHGDEVISGNSDIWSYVDKQGRRWLQISSSDSKKLKKFMDGVLQRTLDSFGIEHKVEDTLESEKTIHNLINLLSSKERNKLYTDYITRVERFLESNYKYLTNYLKELNAYTYNEVILTQWTILEVKSIEQSPHVENICSRLGLRYGGTIPRRDLGKLRIK